MDKQKAENVIKAQSNAQQFKDNYNTEFSAEENVQQAMAKSLHYQAQNQQPTFEPNKPF